MRHAGMESQYLQPRCSSGICQGLESSMDVEEQLLGDGDSHTPWSNQVLQVPSPEPPPNPFFPWEMGAALWRLSRTQLRGPPPQ